MSVILVSSDSDVEVTYSVRYCRKDNCPGRCVDFLVGKGKHLMSELWQMIDTDSGSPSASLGMSDDSGSD